MRFLLPFLLLALPAAAQGPADAPPPAVVTHTVGERDVAPQFRYVGRIEAVERVELRARVEGFLEDQLILDGAPVQAGDVVFRIEQAAYAVVVKQREADLASAQASRANAQSDFDRKATLAQRGNISRAAVDEARAVLASARAETLRAEAALEAAQLDLGYTQVTSPISGFLGDGNFSVGAVVGPGGDPLATVVRTDPVHLAINVPADAILEARQTGELRTDEEEPQFAPRILLRDGTEYPHPGVFDFLDAEVDRRTDTVLARAVFPNPDQLLSPGQFVTAIVDRKATELRVVAPQAAVQRDGQGAFVLVVNRDDTVAERRVRTGDRVDGDIVIEQGLETGERIVLRGLQKVRPGQKVNPSDEAAS